MTSKNTIRLRTPSNMHNQFNSEFKETFNLSKKPKNMFREYSNLSQKKINFYNKPNMYRSFINPSAPFNYYNNPANKNSFLVRYNGGPQKQFQSFIKKDDSKAHFQDKQIIYRNNKPYGNLSKYYMPKLSRSLSCNDYFKNNDMNKTNNHYYNYNNENLAPSNNGLRTFKKYITPNHIRMTKDGKIVLTLKKFRNENNHEDNNNFRYENQNNYDNNEKNDKGRNTFYSSFYCFRPRHFNFFHKTQIFNLCKPFLADEFQEFPDFDKI